jgi:diaminobutyrate-2-oxoglutarate transaminase
VLQLPDAPLLEPRVRTPVPGPESSRLLERQAAYESNARTYPRRLTLAPRRAEGSFVEDLDGNVFIDCLTGAGALPLGHGHPEVVAAVERQLGLLAHGLDFPTEIRDDFIEFVLSRLPDEMQGRTKIQFCGPAGANAVDAALKLCKTATGRGEIVAFQGSFHGSTHSAMSVTGLVAPKMQVANPMPGVHFFPYPYALRCPLPGDRDDVGTRCLDYLERSLTDPFGGICLPAAVILEVVQGEGGVIPAPTDFVRGLRRVTRELGIPLIVDEVQTGYGRTGSWFAFEQHGIVPDVVLASKALGGIGMPIAIMLYDAELDVWGPGAHIGTFRGNQLAFAAGLAAGRIMERDGVLENVKLLGEHALADLEQLARDCPVVAEARGSGLMLGIEIVDPATGEPDGDAAAAVQRAVLERGLIVETGGRQDAVVRLLPPLNITRGTLDQALAILREGVATVCR